MITDMDYLNISALTYDKFNISPEHEGKTIGYIFDNVIPGSERSAPELAALNNSSNPLRDYTIIKVEPNTATGFAGLALQSPSGELVFAFRGTETEGVSLTNPFGNLDIIMDAQLALPGSWTLGPPSQFSDAASFFAATISSTSHTGYSFTGHSLGGGLAQYMTYWTNNTGRSVTFNAVGIGQVIELEPGQTYDSFNSKDFVNENDIIGSFGVQLGTTVYLKDNDPNRINYTQLNDVLAHYALNKALQQSGITMPAGGATGLLIQSYILYRDQINDVISGSLEAHGLASMLVSDGSGNYLFTGDATESKVQGLTDVLTKDGVPVATEVVDGVTYVSVILSTGQEIIVSYFEGVVGVSIFAGQLVWDAIYAVGTTIGDILYDTAVAIGGIGEEFTELAIALYQYFFSEYVVMHGSNDADTLSPIFEKNTIIYGYMGNDSISGSFSDDILDGGQGDDVINGWGGKDYIYGRHGDDIIMGGAGGDALFGGDGDDIIYGGDDRNWEGFFNPEYASDILDGGAGNDILQGGAGDDIYIFGKGYGHDIIYDWAQDVAGTLNAGFDTIRFLANVSSADVAVHRRNSYDLEFKILSTGETITISNYFSGSYYYGSNRIEQAVFSDGTVWDINNLLEKSRHVYGTEADDIIYGYYEQDNIIHAGAGNDVITGQAGADTIYGHAGNDIIEAGAGDDIIDGGLGDDTLKGGAGNDIYVFGRGYGHDTIIDEPPYSIWGDSSAGVDTIHFNADVAVGDIDVYRVGAYDLEFRVRGTNDILTIKNHFSSNNYRSIEAAVFANGNVMWDMQEIYNRAKDTVGTEESESLQGNDADNAISGGGGDDSLYGHAGNDLLDGGSGTDYLNGGAGDDVYVFGLGYGADTVLDSDATFNNIDTVRFLDGISPSDIQIVRSGNNVELRVVGADDRLIIERYFSAYSASNVFVGEGAHKIERFEFSDGTIWTHATIEDAIRIVEGTEASDTIYGYDDLANVVLGRAGNDTIYGGSISDELDGEAGDDVVFGGQGDDTLAGGADNDTLYGDAGNDTLDGGTGDDTLEGGIGDDTYLFGAGYGTDTIYDTDTTDGNIDTITFLGSIAPEDITATRNGENLELTIAGSSDKLIVEKYFSEYARSYGWYPNYVGPNGNKIERITFTDGTVWTVDTIKDIVRHINGTEGDDLLQGLGDQHNVISGGNGNDTIYAGGLGDEMSGGAGNDTIYGSYGNDTLDGGTGNDTLEGSYGNDTYLFNVGSGNDVIYDSDGSENNQDKIIFGNGIAKEDVTLQRSGDDLVFTFADSTDTLTIEKYFSKYARSSGWSQPYVGINGNKIEQIEFADGTIWDNERVIEKVSLILGTSGNDSLAGVEGQQSKLSGLDGDDTLTAASCGDYLDGGAGDDTLNGSHGQDILRGGAGNDTLVGGAGSDTYEFAVGDGHDTIYDGDSSYAADTISFMEGIDPSDVKASRNGNDLVLKINDGTNDSITIQDYFSGVIQGVGYDYGVGVNKVERIMFADGTTWDTISLEDQLRYITGTAGDDTLNGYETDDIITAQEGNDIIHAGAGHDTVDAGAGNDTLYGEAGDDQLSGGAGNDMLDGGVGNDTLDGGTGDDVLTGSEGSDTYIFRLGDGADEIHDFTTNANEIDIVALQTGVSPQDVTVQRSGDDLVLTIANTTDSLTVKGYFSAYRDNDPTEYEIGVNKIELVTFADGTTWNNRTLEYAITNNNGVVDPDITFGTSQNESLFADQDGQTIYADEGDDTITGQEGDDVIYGEAGNDTIYGNQGNDTLIGGVGNDYLDGGEGDDIYRFSPGFGHDTIVDYDTTQGSIDTIAFDTGIIPDDVTLSRIGNNLVLTLTTGDSVTIQGYFAGAFSGYRKIEQVTFANGTIWGTAFLETAVPPTSTYDNTIEGTENNDYLYGTPGNDAISGGAGNDTIYSDNGTYDGIGNDLLDGGTGNDTLYGAGGDDTYVFGLGYGHDYLRDELLSGAAGQYIDGGFDTLKILPGVAPEDIIVRRSGIDLMLEIAGTTDTMTIGAFFREIEGVYASGIERVEFSDLNQTIWTLEDLVFKARNIEGTSGNDVLGGYEGQDNILSAGAGDDTVYGASGNDMLDGGVGNDILRGGYGDDTYIFGIGYGVDTIDDSDSTEGNQDTIQFLEGIDPEDVIVKRNGDNLELSIAGTDDKLIVERYFSPYNRNGHHTGSVDGNKIEHIKFTDNTSWSVADVKDKARHIAGTENNDTIYGYSDQQNIVTAGAGDDTVYAGGMNGDELRGEAGNDSLYGSYGDETLDGGAGDDILEGNSGNDTYLFGRGYGTDTIYDNDTTEGNQDTIQFLEGVAPEDVAVKRNGDNLELSIAGTTSKLIVQNYFSGYYRNSGYYAGENANKIETITFANGTTWDIATVLDKARHISGTDDSETISAFDTNDVITALAGDDTVYAGYGNDTIHGNDGNDVLYGDSGNDQLLGDSGNDTLYGADGNDTLDGGTGNDLLEGSYGNDVYVFGIGYGVDTIYDNDTTQGNVDVVNFLPGIAPTDVNVRRNGDNLELHIVGTEDVLIIERYFSPCARNSWYTYDINMNKIEEFHFDDGTIWSTAIIQDKARFIEGTNGNDTIYGYSDQQNIINAGDGSDIIYAGSMGDQINAGDGSDNVYGSEGADHITGGTGNDMLEGGNGDDTYVFAPGFGVDIIYDNDNGQGNSLDVVEFASGIAPEDVIVRRLSNDDLELSIVGTSDKLTVQRYFSRYYRNSSWNTGVDSNTIEEFRFADNTVWDIATIKDKVRFLEGTAGDDFISGFSDQQNIISAGDGNDTLYAASSLNDELYGEAGNDSLYGTSSNDKLDGGAGNDYLEGSTGDDTYVFGLGYGQDVIYDSNQGQSGGIDKVVFLSGISPADVTAKRLSNSDLELTFAGSSDKLTIERYFSPYYKNSSWNAGTDSNVVEEFHFVDNTAWNIDDIKAMVRTVNGTENNDVLYGYEDTDTISAGGGDDTVYAGHADDVINGGAGNDALYGEDGNDQLDGGTGNDTLDGGYGDDLYVFSGAFGNDQINDYHGNDLVQFNDLSKDNIMFEQFGNTLQITSAGISDSVSIGYWYSYNDYKVETIKASDGSTINSTQVEQLIQAMASWSNDNNGMSWGQALSSNQQDVQAIITQYWAAPTA